MKRRVIIVLACMLFAHNVQATINPQVGDSVWEIVSKIGLLLDSTASAAASTIPVFDTDAVDNVITLTIEGANYRVAEQLTNRIVIAENEICLDLDCKKITLSDGTLDIITVESDKKRVKIFNGFLCNTFSPTGTAAGILIEDGSSLVKLKEISIEGCGNGVKLAGTDGNEVIACELVALDLVGNTTGVLLVRADENIIKDCRAARNTQADLVITVVGSSIRNEGERCSVKTENANFF